jgi:hypothetical protein
MNIKALIRMVWDALLLAEHPYGEMREQPNPVLRGLVIVILIGLAVPLLGLVGTAGEWATTPNMGAVRDAVFEGLQEMPWYQELQHEPQFRQEFQRWYDVGWRIFPRLFDAPDLASAASMIIILPLRLTFTWLLYGLVAYLIARLLGGQGGLGQTLGCTALAVAPQVLNMATLLPYVVVGGVVGTWTLVCRYVALKTCHQLSWGRTLATTLLPYIVFAVIISLFGCLAGTVLGFIFGGGASR